MKSFIDILKTACDETGRSTLTLSQKAKFDVNGLMVKNNLKVGISFKNEEDVKYVVRKVDVFFSGLDGPITKFVGVKFPSKPKFLKGIRKPKKKSFELFHVQEDQHLHYGNIEKILLYVKKGDEKTQVIKMDSYVLTFLNSRLNCYE